MAVVHRLETDPGKPRGGLPPRRRGPAEIVILPCIRREPLVAAAAAKPA